MYEVKKHHFGGMGHVSGQFFLSPVRGGRRGGYTHCTTGLVLLSIFNIRMKKKGVVMDYGNEKLSYFFYYVSWNVIGGHGKEIQKNREKETGSFRGTTARAHEVG